MSLTDLSKIPVRELPKDMSNFGNIQRSPGTPTPEMRKQTTVGKFFSNVSGFISNNPTVLADTVAAAKNKSGGTQLDLSKYIKLPPVEFEHTTAKETNKLLMLVGAGVLLFMLFKKR